MNVFMFVSFVQLHACSEVCVDVGVGLDPIPCPLARMWTVQKQCVSGLEVRPPNTIMLCGFAVE